MRELYCENGMAEKMLFSTHHTTTVYAHTSPIFAYHHHPTTHTHTNLIPPITDHQSPDSRGPMQRLAPMLG